MTLREWMEARIERTPDGCWMWTGRHDRDGYGRIPWQRVGRPGQSLYGAHRVMYEMEVGPIPAGLMLDHLCVHPPCVNPAHLEPVTNRENLRRAAGPYCKRGHEKAIHLATGRNGERYCKRCHADYERDRYRRRVGLPVHREEVAA